MTTHFIILDPRRDKRAIMTALLAPLGCLCWLSLVPLRRQGYPETAALAQTALEAATRIPANPIIRRLKLALLAAQYNGARAPVCPRSAGP